MTAKSMPASPASPAPDQGPYPHFRRVSGPVRPCEEVLVELEAWRAELRDRIRPPDLATLIVPDPADLFRWKVALACGHNTETMTGGRNSFPDRRQYLDPLTRTSLSLGEMWCRDESHLDEPEPYQEIVEWVSSKVITFRPDPVQPRHGLDAATWNLIRHSEPYSRKLWRVRLACDHHYDHVSTATDWTPERGPERAPAARADQMREELEDHWAQDPVLSPRDKIEQGHLRRMVDLRWPTPEPEHACRTCTRAHRIEGYQRIGWLIARPKPTPPATTERQVLQVRLDRAEADVSRLRRELDELG